MKTLIIYDLEGHIIQQISGDYRKPVGIPFLEIDVPIGKYVTSVNVETEEAIFEDLPKSETEILRERIEEQELAILELAEMLGGAI